MHRIQQRNIRNTVQPVRTLSQTHNFLAIETKDSKVPEMIEKELRVLFFKGSKNHIEDSKADGCDKKSTRDLD